MSSTTAPPRTGGRAPRRFRESSIRRREPASRRREHQTLRAPAEAGGSIAQIRTSLTETLQVLKRHGEWAETGLRREIARVRTLVSDEVRFYRENQPPLLNPVPFPL